MSLNSKHYEHNNNISMTFYKIDIYRTWNLKNVKIEFKTTIKLKTTVVFKLNPSHE